jgi:hypothetical protein
MSEEQTAESGPIAEELIPPPAPEQPSRFTLWLRRALGWAIAVIVVFGLGAAANWWFQLRPKAAALDQATAQLQTANQELETLRPLAAEAEELRGALGRAERRGLALEALADVNEARVAVAGRTAAAARPPLARADVLLVQLKNLLEGEQADAVTDIRERLTLAGEELDSDLFAAQRDLEIVTNSLAELAEALGEG